MTDFLNRKNKIKAFLCVALAFCVMLGVFAPFTKLFVSADTPFTKMLYFKSSSPEELMQTAPVNVGETYNFTFGLSAAIENFEIVCQTDDRRREIDAAPELVSKEEKGDSYVYTYSITIPQKTVNNKPITEKVFVGILFSGNVEGYLYEPSLYVASDEAKTELFANRFNGGVLDGWTYGYTWFGEWEGTDVTEWSDDANTLKIVNYDDSLFGGTGSGSGGDSSSNKKMYYIKSSGPKEIMRLVPVTPGETYYMTFGMSSSIRRFDLAFVGDEGRAWIDEECPQLEKISKGNCNIYTYSCTVPEDYEFANAFFGVKPYGKVEGYIFDIAVYKADDASKSNLMVNADFSDAFNGWSYGWDAWFGTWDPADATVWESEIGETHIEIVDYDEELLGLNNEVGGGDTAQKMLHINSPGPKSLIQRAEVSPGKEYIFSFGISKSIRKFDPVCFADGGRAEVDANITQVSAEDKGNYTIYSYKYTIPADYGESMIFFGMQPSGSTDGYFFNASVYAADDANKNELLDNPMFEYALAEWSWGWDVWFGYFSGDSDDTEWTSEDGKTTLKVVNFDSSLFGEGGEVDSGKKMLYFVNGPTGSQFALLAKVEAGKTYCLEFGMFATGTVNFKVARNGLRATVESVQQNLETKEEGNYTRYKYTFTMPENETDGEYFIGPDVTGFVEGYMFDLTLYEVGAENKKELLSNPEFEYGLDDWIWGWNAWFGVLDEAGLTEWTDGSNTLKIMKHDLNKIDELIKLINVDDGEWWDEKDIIPEEIEEIASLKGTLKDQNNAPLANVELIFASDERELTATTNVKGEFNFNSFPAGFYELYTVDSKGNRVATGYYGTLSHGDDAAVDIVCDTTSLLADSENNTQTDDTQNNNTQTDDTQNNNTEQEEKPSVGAINGAVYTPELKTVANLKLYIRGVGDTFTDSKGEFSFTDVPVGEYELYTVLDDGKEYVFRTVNIKENVELSVKLKYDVAEKTIADVTNNNTLIIIVIAGAAVLLAAVGAVVFIVIKKKKA